MTHSSTLDHILSGKEQALCEASYVVSSNLRAEAFNYASESKSQLVGG